MRSGGEQEGILGVEISEVGEESVRQCGWLDGDNNDAHESASIRNETNDKEFRRLIPRLLRYCYRKHLQHDYIFFYSKVSSFVVIIKNARRKELDYLPARLSSDHSIQFIDRHVGYFQNIPSLQI